MKLIIFLALIGAAYSFNLPVRATAGEHCSSNADCDCPSGFVSDCRDRICRCHHDGHVTPHPDNHHPDNHHPDNHQPDNHQPDNHHPNNHVVRAGEHCSSNADCHCPHDFVSDCQDRICRCHHNGHDNHHPDNHQPDNHHPDNHHPNNHVVRAGAGEHCSSNADCHCPHDFVSDCQDRICRCHHNGHDNHHPDNHQPDNHQPDNHHPNNHVVRAGVGEHCSANADCHCPPEFVSDCQDRICRCHHNGHDNHHPDNHQPDNHHPDNHHPNNHVVRAGAGEHCSSNADCHCPHDFVSDCQDRICRCHHNGHDNHHPDNHQPDNHHPNNHVVRAGAGEHCSSNADCHCPHEFVSDCQDRICRCHHNGHDNHHPDNHQPDNHHPDNHHPNNHVVRAGAGEHCSSNADCHCPHDFVSDCQDRICRCHHNGHDNHHPDNHQPDNHQPDNHHPNNHVVRAGVGEHCSANADCHCPPEFVSDCQDRICRCHHNGHDNHHPDNHQPDNHQPDNHHPNNHVVRAGVGEHCSANADCHCPPEFVSDCQDRICRCHHNGHDNHHPDNHQPDNHQPDNHHPNNHVVRAGVGEHCSANADCHCPPEFVSDCQDRICRCHHGGHVTPHPDNHHPDNHHPDNHQPDNHHPNNHVVRAGAGEHCSSNADCHCPHDFVSDCQDRICRCHHNGHDNHHPDNHQPDNHQPDNHHPNNHVVRAGAGEHCSANADCHCPHDFVSDCQDRICRCHHKGHDNHHPDNHQPDNHQPDNHHPNNHVVRAGAGEHCSANADCHCPHDFVSDCQDRICRCHHNGHDNHHPDNHQPDNHQPDNHHPNHGQQPAN